MSRQNAQLAINSTYSQAGNLLGVDETLRRDYFEQKGIHFYSSSKLYEVKLAIESII
ncbi:hypothetical protein D3C81_2341320 [compost metagenome]